MERADPRRELSIPWNKDCEPDCGSHGFSLLVCVAEADGALITEHHFILGRVDCTPGEYLAGGMFEPAGSASDDHTIGIGGGIQSGLAAGISRRVRRWCQDRVPLGRDPVVLVVKG